MRRGRQGFLGRTARRTCADKWSTSGQSGVVECLSRAKIGGCKPTIQQYRSGKLDRAWRCTAVCPFSLGPVLSTDHLNTGYIGRGCGHENTYNNFIERWPKLCTTSSSPLALSFSSIASNAVESLTGKSTRRGPPARTPRPGRTERTPPLAPALPATPSRKSPG